MAVVTFDTLKFANTLKAAGVPEKQAEAQASAFAEVMHVNFKELVTKDDLERGLMGVKTEVLRSVLDLRTEMSSRFDASEQKLNARIDNLGTKLHGDIDNLGARLHGDIGNLDSKYRGENNLLRWMVGVGLLGTLALLIRSFFLRGPLI